MFAVSITQIQGQTRTKNDVKIPEISSLGGHYLHFHKMMKKNLYA